MPIEFHCVECKKLLRMSDEAAGAKARCPQCGAISVVPAASQMSPPTPPPEANPFAQSSVPEAPLGANPYSTPTHIPVKSKAPATGQPTSVEVGEVIGYGWEVWKANLGILVGMTLLILGINIGSSMLQQGIMFFFQQQGSPEVGLIVGFVAGLIGNIVQFFLTIGQTKVILRLFRGQSAEIGHLFSGGKQFLPTLGASIVAGLALMLGFVLLIVPGILMMLYFWPYYYFVVDERAKAMDSFSAGMSIAKLNVGTSIVLALASMGIGFLGMLACFVGIFFAAPLINTIWVAAYLMMSGQIGARPRMG